MDDLFELVEVFNSEVYSTEHLIDGSSLGESATLVAFIGFLNKQLDIIPEPCRSNALIDIESFDSYGSASSRLVITYKRPLTPAEIQARQEAEAGEKKLRLDRSYALYLKLKAEFESKP